MESAHGFIIVKEKNTNDVKLVHDKIQTVFKERLDELYINIKIEKYDKAIVLSDPEPEPEPDSKGFFHMDERDIAITINEGIGSINYKEYRLKPEKLDYYDNYKVILKTPYIDIFNSAVKWANPPAPLYLPGYGYSSLGREPHDSLVSKCQDLYYETFDSGNVIFIVFQETDKVLQNIDKEKIMVRQNGVAIEYIEKQKDRYYLEDKVININLKNLDASQPFELVHTLYETKELVYSIDLSEYR